MFDIMVKFQAQWRPGDPTPGVCPECREYTWRSHFACNTLGVWRTTGHRGDPPWMSGEVWSKMTQSLCQGALRAWGMCSAAWRTT